MYSVVQQDTDDDRPSANDSDLTIPREFRLLEQHKKNLDDRLGYTSSATASSSSDMKRSYYKRKVTNIVLVVQTVSIFLTLLTFFQSY